MATLIGKKLSIFRDYDVLSGIGKVMFTFAVRLPFAVAREALAALRP